MTGGGDDLLACLQEAAAAASRAEDDYRRNHAERLRQLERIRVFAHRRAHLVAELLGAVGAVEPDAAAGAAEAVLRAEFGLTRERESHRTILDRFADVTAVLAGLAGTDEAPPEAGDALAALELFEAWFEAAHGSPFLALSDVYVPMTPVVDF